MVRQHNGNYQMTNPYQKPIQNDVDSDADSDDMESSDTMSVDSDIDMRMYGDMPPRHSYNAPASAPSPSSGPKNVEHFDNGDAGSADCASHLQHFIDCPRCNKMIRQRIEAFMNLEQKDAKMMRAMRKNYGGGGPLSASFYPKLDQGQLYINPGTASPVKIRERFSGEGEQDEDSENGEEMREHFGMVENKWWNSIGEIFLLIFIGVVFIYLMDLFVNMGMKWKK